MCLSPRILAAAAALVLLPACAFRVTREQPAPAEVAEMPWTPGTKEAVLDWVRAHADPRDSTCDLDGPFPYVETALPPGAPVSRVGFFFTRDPWKVAAVTYWFSRDAAPPETEGRDGALWGLPLFSTHNATERYAPGARLIVREVNAAFTLPAAPAVDLPADVPIKSPTRTFDRDHLLAISGGRLWFKRNPARDGTREEPWRPFGDGLPGPFDPEQPFDRPRTLVSVSADADDVLVVDDRSRVYLCTTKSKSLTSSSGWLDGWGYPGKRPLVMDGRAKGARAFALGRRAQDAVYFEDAIGNRHNYAPMGTSTLYLLPKRGNEVLFTDNGLPNDFSRDLCPPDDGRFVAENLSASASALFLIDRRGRMVTRFDDYDLNGGTPNFEYTYRSEVRDDTGDELLSSQTPYYLPLLPWRTQPPPKLEGQARLSLDITILQTGAGNAARELRVAGLDAGGRTGYWKKGIDEAAWTFVPGPDVHVDPSRLLSAEDLAAPPDPPPPTYRAQWTGALQLLHADKPAERLDGVTVRMDWNPWCPPARLTFEVKGASFPVTLHTVDLWTPLKRDHPGFDGTPLLLLGTLVLDDAVLTDQRPAVRKVVEVLRRYHHANFAFLVALDGDRADVRSIDEGPGASHPIALTFQRDAGWISPEPERPSPGRARPLVWLSSDPGELLTAPGLVVDARTATDEALQAAIRENTSLKAELDGAREKQAEAQKLIEDYRGSIRLLAPLLPLGRTRLLPKLLLVQTSHGGLTFSDVDGVWRAASAVLADRIAAYEAALAARHATSAPRPATNP